MAIDDATLKKQMLLTFWFCSVRKDLLRELIENKPYQKTHWKTIGISPEALDLTRNSIRGLADCLNRVADEWDPYCHRPPCPITDDTFLKSFAAWVMPVQAGAAPKRRPKSSR